MKTTAVLSVFFCLLSVQFVAAQNLSVSYLEGQAQLSNGGIWTELAIGDAVPPDSAIRLTANAFLQVKGTGIEFTFNRPGIYAVRDVVAARRAMSFPGVGAALGQSFRHLTFGPTGGQSTAMGARGANQSKQDTEEWMESSAQVFLAAGKEYIKIGKCDKAIEQFKEALESASEQESLEVHYYLAYASSLNGNVREAWKEAAGLQPGATDAWAGDFILLKAKLLEDTSAYREAVTWLTEAGSALSQDAQRAPLYYFLLGLGYRGAGESENARQALSKAAAISAESDLGKAASEIMQLP